jgi:cleavage and polyadenylation specificity factor subunit 1
MTDLKTMDLEISELTHMYGPRIVISTGVQKGEDSPARGVVYVLETLDVVPDPDELESGIQLRLVSREETKGIVTALHPFPGGLIGTAQGQKLMVRGLKEDGSCLPVAFLDAQAYTVSLRALGNSGLWLAADAAKGLWFGGFTQEPYRLTVLGKSRTRMEVLAAEILPFDGGLYICVVNSDLDLQVLQYDPENPKTLNGSRLLYRSTFHLGYAIDRMQALPSTLSMQATTLGVNGLGDEQGTEPSPVFQVLTTSPTGAVGLITPLDETSYRRLGSLQTHLSNVLEHAAGLNPRAFRSAGEEGSAGRGVVDGTIIKRIWELGSVRRAEVLARAGSDSWVLQSDLEHLDGLGLPYI